MKKQIKDLMEQLEVCQDSTQSEECLKGKKQLHRQIDELLKRDSLATKIEGSMIMERG